MADMMALTGITDDPQERMRAFVEKRMKIATFNLRYGTTESAWTIGPMKVSPESIVISITMCGHLRY